MATSSKRLGVTTDDEELESRLRKMELELEKRQAANYQVSSNATRRNRSPLPRVVGLELDDSITGAISVNWDAVDANINRYEVEFADNAAFTSATRFKVNVPSFVLPATLDPARTYRMRVRAVGTRVKRGFHDEGDWSVAFEIEPGQATFTNLVEGAAGNVIKYEFSATAFDVLLVTSAPGVTDYDQQILDIPQFNLPTSATCLFTVMHQYLWGEQGTPAGSEGIQRSDSIRFRLYLDGQEALFTFNKRFKDAAITKWDRWQDTVTLVGPPQVLEAGIHKLKYRIEQERDTTASNGNDCFLTTQNLVLSILEVRR